MYSALGNEYQVFPISRGRGLGPSDAGPPINTLLPSLSQEIGFIGDIVYCNAGEWENTKYFLYQWHRDGVSIWGAMEDHYRAREEDYDNTLTCAVTGYNSLGSLTVMSSNSFVMTDWIFDREHEVLYDRDGDELRARVI